MHALILLAALSAAPEQATISQPGFAVVVAVKVLDTSDGAWHPAEPDDGSTLVRWYGKDLRQGETMVHLDWRGASWILTRHNGFGGRRTDLNLGPRLPSWIRLR